MRKQYLYDAIKWSVAMRRILPCRSTSLLYSAHRRRRCACHRLPTVRMVPSSRSYHEYLESVHYSLPGVIHFFSPPVPYLSFPPIASGKNLRASLLFCTPPWYPSHGLCATAPCPVSTVSHVDVPSSASVLWLPESTTRSSSLCVGSVSPHPLLRAEY